MSNLKANIRWFSAAILATLCLSGITMHVVTASDNTPNALVEKSFAAKTASEALPHEVIFQRNPDYACIQCHKKEENKLLGVHGDIINTKTDRDFSCIDCHTSITQAHRDGANDVVKFIHAQSVKGVNVAPAHRDLITQQNESCESCHLPVELREANWTHDVHARDLSCASCHTVHPAKDPMQGLSRKAKITTCVNCHGDQYQAREDMK